MSNPSPLLTIAIPTYNRAADLTTALAHIAGQLGPVADAVEVLVSDNCSTDGTEGVVRKYIEQGFRINYYKNRENIGPDNNFLQCFNAASGKYVWILGDDDIVLDGALARILPVLASGEYGLLYLNSYGFAADPAAERPGPGPEGYEVYDTPPPFLARAGYFLTFISTSVVNKELAARNMDVESFRSTNLIQLAWTFNAVFNARSNAFLKSYAVAAKTGASGGYKLCQVFGRNFQRAFDIYIAKGVPVEYFEIIKKKMLANFFPANIIRARRNMFKGRSEDYFGTLYPLFRRYPSFWIFTVPAIFLPSGLAFMLYSAALKLRRLKAARGGRAA
jgi:glycosyltransferase involved in cell wall biosynthesis